MTGHVANFLKPSVVTSYGISAFQFSTVKIWESAYQELKNYKSFLLTTQNWPQFYWLASLKIAIQYAGHFLFF